MTPALQLHQVTRRYTPGNPPAVDGLSLDVASGELLALVGESGSGKTTLLRLICGLEHPDGGEVMLNGTPVAGNHVQVPPEKRQVGMVFQSGALFPHLTVEANVAYGLRKACRKKVCQRVESLLCLVGMDGYQKRYPHELSGGERQRLAVIRALAPEPEVVLLDEPFSNLDPSLRRGLRAEIHRILKELRTTAILVTHDTEDALHVGDRVAVMCKGQIEQLGTPREVYHHPGNAHCARLFGAANRLNGHWIRPEDMELLPAYAPDCHPVLIQQIRDAGKHLEITAQPQETESEETWVLYDTTADWVRPGTPGWVKIREPTPQSGPTASKP